MLHFPHFLHPSRRPWPLTNVTVQRKRLGELNAGVVENSPAFVVVVLPVNNNEMGECLGWLLEHTRTQWSGKWMSGREKVESVSKRNYGKGE